MNYISRYYFIETGIWESKCCDVCLCISDIVKSIKTLCKDEGINKIDETNFVKICNLVEKKLKITTKEAVVALFEMMN